MDLFASAPGDLIQGRLACFSKLCLLCEDADACRKKVAETIDASLILYVNPRMCIFNIYYLFLYEAATFTLLREKEVSCV